MRNKVILIGIGIVIGLLLATAGIAWAGSLDPTAGPSSVGSQMYTLDQIYHRLDSGATATKMTSFTEPSAGPGSTMHTLDEIYALAGSRAFVPKTGVVDETPGSDGNLKKGVAWPMPRFTDNGNGTVTDNLTGLIWLKNANCFGAVANGPAAIAAANTLDNGECGLSDGSAEGAWRLANIRELQSLLHYRYYNPALPNTLGTGQWAVGDPFTNVQSARYWTSTGYAQWPSSTFWVVDLSDGITAWVGPHSPYVWPVRGGQ